MSKNRYYAFGVFALVIGLAIFLYLVWAKHRDYSPQERLGQKGEITYDGRQLAVDVVCVCPTVLTESITRQLNFEVTFTAPPSAQTVTSSDEIVETVNAGNSVLEYKPAGISVQALSSGRPITHSLSVAITPKDTALAAIVLQFVSKKNGVIGIIEWPMQSQSTARAISGPYIYSGLIMVVAFAIFVIGDRQMAKLKQRAEAQLQAARTQAENNPKDARYAWNLARVTLEQYFSRNLIQVNLVFWVAVFVMGVGFILIVVAIMLAVKSTSVTPASLVSAISGALAQFIGATFMVIYKSTMSQANDFVGVLNGINRVGMAAQMLDGIDEGPLKSQTRARMAVTLLGGADHAPAPEPPASNGATPP